MIWNASFIVFVILALCLTVLTKNILQEKGYKVSWIANINQWWQLFDLIKKENKKSNKWKYSVLLFLLVLSTIGAFVSMYKS